MSDSQQLSAEKARAKKAEKQRDELLDKAGAYFGIRHAAGESEATKYWVALRDSVISIRAAIKKEQG